MSALDGALAKRRFYRRPDVVAEYERRRFGGPSGAHVEAREAAIVCELLPAGELIADVGAGTGHIGARLQARGDRVISVDTSLPMLQAARKVGMDQLVGADAFRLPFGDGVLDGAIAIRLLFHLASLAPLLAELRRVVRPGGTLVADTYTWSARALAPVRSQYWGPRVHTISRGAFLHVSELSGWHVRGARGCFIASPYLYRLAPLRLSLAMEGLESHVPARLLSRVFWQLQAIKHAD